MVSQNGNIFWKKRVDMAQFSTTNSLSGGIYSVTVEKYLAKSRVPYSWPPTYVFFPSRFVGNFSLYNIFGNDKAMQRRDQLPWLFC